MHSKVMAIHARNAPQIFKQPSDKAFDAIAITEYLEDRGFIFVASAGDNVVGYLSGRVVEKPEDIRRKRRDMVHLDAIYVDKSYRGDAIGIGRHLVDMSRALAVDKGVSLLVFDVWTFNRTALQFCQDLGFVLNNLVMYDIVANK